MLDQSLLMSEERKQQQTDLFNKTRLRVKFESQGPLKTSAEDFKKLVFMDIITREEYEQYTAEKKLNNLKLCATQKSNSQAV